MSRTLTGKVDTTVLVMHFANAVTVPTAASGLAHCVLGLQDVQRLLRV